MLARTVTHALVGLDTRRVEVEAHLQRGVPGFSIVGLADRACQEAKERVRSGIASAELEWPLRRITVNLAPAGLRKEGSGFDLPIALSILAASGQIPRERLAEHAAVGELALDGRLRPVGGVLALAEAARRAGLSRILCAARSAAEAALADIEPVPLHHLAEAAAYLRGEGEPEPYFEENGHPPAEEALPDLADVRGQERARRALEIAATGGHNLLLAGPPGTGKTMLARRLPGILPPLSTAEALEVTRIHSVAGMLSPDRPLVTTRPLRSPHYSASVAALVGGGSGPRPGEVSLAHRGVLVLDEFAEFQRPALEALRQPLEDGIVSIARVEGRAIFPARFQLVAAMNLCPCGARGDPVAECKCSPQRLARSLPFVYIRSMAKAGAKLDGYLRVSRLAGREGDSFISPEVQREKIEAWAKLHDAQIVEWHEELDESGAKRDRPKFQEALARCERGETGGIVVARLDRFARSAVDALESIKRLEKSGARLVSVEDGFDDSTAMGRFARGILLLLAELEWERIRGNWETAIGRAVADGVHVSGLVPTGYKRNGKRSRLVPDRVAAPVVREAFRMRASGASCEKIARYFEEKGVTPPTGNPHWSRQGVRALLQNKVYIGQARGWKGKDGEQPMVNDHAHEALVTREEFEAAQDVKPYPHRHDGSIAAQVMLAGLIKCAGCGHNLTYTGTTNRDGRRTASYMCRGRYATGICPAPAAARAEIVDAFVREVVVLALVEGILDRSLDQVLRYDQAQQAVADTQRDLDALANPDLLRTLGPERLAQMAEPLRAAHEAARQQLRETPKPGEAVMPSPKMWAYGWNEDEPIERQRQLCRQFIQRIELRRSGKRGKAAGPISNRLSITWVGDDEPDTAIVERVAAAPRLEFIGDSSARPRAKSSAKRRA